MAKTKKDQRHNYDDDDSNFNKHKKHAKHSTNFKGRGMRVINRYVEEEYGDFNDDEFDDTSDSTKTKNNFYTQTIR
jgi:hypothetical protein